jgi:hypothetical protein
VLSVNNYYDKNNKYGNTNNNKITTQLIKNKNTNDDKK